MEVSSSNLDSTRVLQVRGRLDHSHAKEFETALAPHLLRQASRLDTMFTELGKEARVLSLAAGVSRVEKLNPKDPGQLEVAKALIDKGAKVNAVSSSGVTPLLLAAAHNNAPIVGLLVEAGADLSSKTPAGETAEQLARANGNNAVVSLLNLMSQAKN